MAPDNVVDVPVIGIGEENPTLIAFSHLTTLPVLPLRVRSAGDVPEQIV